MQVLWQSCPRCTGREPLVRSPKSQIDLTVDHRAGDGGTDRTVMMQGLVGGPRTRAARLVATSSEVSPREILLAPGSTRLGKAPTESPDHHRIAITGDDRMSRNHSVIVMDQEEIVISDAGSTNGTYVNDRRIEQTPLHDGDSVQLGETVFRFEILS